MNPKWPIFRGVARLLNGAGFNEWAVSNFNLRRGYKAKLVIGGFS